MTQVIGVNGDILYTTLRSPDKEAERIQQNILDAAKIVHITVITVGNDVYLRRRTD